LRRLGDGDQQVLAGGGRAQAVGAALEIAAAEVGAGDMARLGEAGVAGQGEDLLRGEEAERAAKVMGLAARENLELPDGGVTNTPETRSRLAVLIRQFAPSVVIAPSLQGKHPDHTVSAQLIRDACFVAGLQKVEPDVPAHRPKKIVHCLAYREDYVKPTFVVDISDVFEKKFQAIKCYSSQFDEAVRAGEVNPNGEPLYDIVRHHAAHYGSLIRTRYGEPFFTTETMRVDDIASLEVATF